MTGGKPDLSQRCCEALARCARKSFSAGIQRCSAKPSRQSFIPRPISPQPQPSPTTLPASRHPWRKRNPVRVCLSVCALPEQHIRNDFRALRLRMTTNDALKSVIVQYRCFREVCHCDAQANRRERQTFDALNAKASARRL